MCIKKNMKYVILGKKWVKREGWYKVEGRGVKCLKKLPEFEVNFPSRQVCGVNVYFVKYYTFKEIVFICFVFLTPKIEYFHYIEGHQRGVGLHIKSVSEHG